MEVKYIGNNIYSEFAFRKAAESEGIVFSQLDYDEGRPMAEVTEELIGFNSDIYIIDISAFSEEEREIAEQLTRLKNAMNAQVIIHAPLYNDESKILLDLKALGFSHIITAMENQGILQQSMIEAINMCEVEELDEQYQETLIREIEEQNRALEEELPCLTVLREQQEEKAEPGSILKIAVIGSREFIGTTTVALQLVKHLNQRHEASAAYIELNKSRYIKNIREYYEVDQIDGSLASITMGGITMFEDARKMPQILSEGFAYYIYDYGSIGNVNDLSSIYEKDIIILVGGMKPNELSQTTEAMDELYEQRNLFYVLNHIPSKSRAEALLLMEDRRNRTFFFEESPAPFIYNPKNAEMFDTILSGDYKPEMNMKRKKIWRVFK